MRLGEINPLARIKPGDDWLEVLSNDERSRSRPVDRTPSVSPRPDPPSGPARASTPRNSAASIPRAAADRGGRGPRPVERSAPFRVGTPPPSPGARDLTRRLGPMAVPDAPDESTSRMGPYDVLEQIGKGAFGAAWIIQTRGNDSNPPRRFVLKKIPLARLSERQRHLSLQERQLVAALRHPYVVPYHRSWIERSHTVCIVMRHCDGGDLASAAWRARRRRERFPESTLRLWLAQLLSALAYLHSERVIHRDVKCRQRLPHVRRPTGRDARRLWPRASRLTPRRRTMSRRRPPSEPRTSCRRRC